MTFGCRTIISIFYNLMSITRLVTFSQRTAIFFALLLIFLFKLLTHSKNVIEVYPALALTLQFRPRELGSNLFPKYLCLLTSPITVGFNFYKPVVFKRNITVSPTLLFSFDLRSLLQTSLQTSCKDVWYNKTCFQ